MDTVLGLDIGGNHSKFTLLQKKGEDFVCDAGCVAMGPGAPTLSDVIKNLFRDVGTHHIDVVGVTTSYPAGLAIPYRDGLSLTVETLVQVFPEDCVYVADFTGNLYPACEIESQKDPLIFSATNFFGSAKVGTKLLSDGIVLDMGSTSTDILAVKSGTIAFFGPDNTPLKRHMTGEMNWLGVFSTPVALLSRYVPFKGRMVPVSQGNFYIADALNMLYPEEMLVLSQVYGRIQWKVSDSYNNMARLINLDPSCVSQQEAAAIARYILLKAVSTLRDSLFLLLSFHNMSLDDTTFLVMGVGKDIFLTPALQMFGVNQNAILDIEDFVPSPVWPFASSLGVAIHTMEHFCSGPISLSAITFPKKGVVIQ
jgi:uncharacterized hydantoinase/oxoprolinase family protein